ncbi:MAG: V-type ATP synthase subunit E family protein [Thaumarchaeota archaeon]|nr:V-type ATP synthase subunit E family protein [Nitrososphaerota archaeon]
MDRNATRNTLGKVSSQFSSEVLADTEEGKRKALNHLESTRRATVDEISKINETSAKKAESLRRQIIGSAELDVRNMELRVLEEAVNAVFEEALSSLEKTPSSAYEKALSRLISEGTEVLGDNVTVACNAKDRKMVASVLKELNKGPVKVTLSDESINVLGGVAMTSKDGSVRFENTFEARLERFRPLLRKDVAGLLRGG